MQIIKYKPFLWFAALLLLLPALCLAELTLEDAGLAYLPAEGESCLTWDGRMAGDALPESLGMGLEEAQALLSGGGTLLLIEQPDGRQARLRIAEQPEGISADSVFSMSEEQKAQMLEGMKRQFSDDGGAWLADQSGYASFENDVSAASSPDAPSLSLCELKLAAPYLGKLIVLETDVIGRAATDGDRALLQGIAERLLRLGAKEAPGEGAEALPEVTASSGDPAEMIVVSDALPLTIDPVSKDFPATTLMLTGTTKNGISMRYYVNEKASSRFYSEMDGTFRVTVPTLENGKDNLIRVVATEGDLKGEINFTLHVDRQPVPVRLSLQMGCVTGDEITVEGRTLAGAKVAFGKRTAKSTLETGKDGSFTVLAKLPQTGENKLTLNISYKGYADNKVELNYVRLPQTSEELAQMTSDMPKIAYDALLSSPSDYQSDMLYLEGTITGLCYREGKTYCQVTTGDGSAYTARMDNLYGLTRSAPVRLLALCAGENASIFGTSNPLLQALARIGE